MSGRDCVGVWRRLVVVELEEAGTLCPMGDWEPATLDVQLGCLVLEDGQMTGSRRVLVDHSVLMT